MNKIIKYLFLVSFLSAFASPAFAYILSSTEVEHDVRVRIVSHDQVNNTYAIKLSGENCQYCDRTFIANAATILITDIHDGSIQYDLLDQMKFALASVHIYIDDGVIEAINFTDYEY